MLLLNFGTLSKSKTTGIYQLVEFVELKSAFIYFVILTQQLKHSEFIN